MTKFMLELWNYEGVYSEHDQAVNRVLLIMVALIILGIATSFVSFVARGLKAWRRS